MRALLTSVRRPLLAVIGCLVVILGMLVVTAPAEAARQPLGTYRCTAWKYGARDCAKFGSMTQHLHTDYTRTIHNTFATKTVSFTCSTSKQTTWKFSVSASVKAQAGVIFAKAEASATAGVERSVTTTDAVSATMNVKPGGWAYCKRGVYSYAIKGTLRHTRCSGPHCSHSYRGFTATAPSREIFMVGPGRG